jgi:hypothetical protein
MNKSANVYRRQQIEKYPHCLLINHSGFAATCSKRRSEINQATTTPGTTLAFIQPAAPFLPVPAQHDYPLYVMM